MNKPIRRPANRPATNTGKREPDFPAPFRLETNCFIHKDDFSVHLQQSQLDSETRDAYKPLTQRPSGRFFGLAE